MVWLICVYICVFFERIKNIDMQDYIWFIDTFSCLSTKLLQVKLWEIQTYLP